ncbi:MAG: D-aminoacylase [Rhodobacteraceae bacterium]|nr:D-aminoacylase [Paracoccaceae bacterium]MAY44180.1 D-aminoacylase [Paracoccaceae bacterium]
MQADMIIHGAQIIDGTGAPRHAGDLAVTDDRISAIGTLAHWQAGRRVDGAGLILAPGFIDPHVHHDAAVLTDPDMPFMVSQGVTTVINGNCGFSIAPISTKGPLPLQLDMIIGQDLPRFPSYAAYHARLAKAPPAVNAACLIGHSTLRANAMGDLDQPATPDELQAMCRQLEIALSEGAIGLSTGPFYAPSRAAPTSELTALARVAARAGAIYVTHMRDEGDRVIEALNETFAVGRDGCCDVHVSHHKCAGLANHGLSTTTLAMIDDFGRDNPVGLDTTPWIASSTVLNSGRHRQATRVIVAQSQSFPDLAGRDLADIAADWGCDLDAAVDRLMPATGIFFIMDEADVQRILGYRQTMICSDGISGGTHPHPRVWGTFPRVLGRYARDLGLFSLEEAVQRMTSMPADRFGLGGRGRITVGGFADLVLFDADKIREGATFETPIRPAAGIARVFVNGREVWADGQPTGARPGRPLTRTAPGRVVSV